MAPKNKFLKKANAGEAKPASFSKRHGLGRGLDGLLGSKSLMDPVPLKVPAGANTTEQLMLELPILDIDRSPYQPRRDFKPEELKELSESLKNNGLVQPPTVRKNSAGRYELIAGERRLRAAQQIGWKKIRVTLVEADDLTAAAMTMTENLQREDLNPIEEAVSYKTLLDRFNLTQQEVAERVGKGRASVANAVRLLELPDEVKQLLSSSLLSVGHAKVLLGVEDEKDRVLLARSCVNDQLTVRALERKIAKLNEPISERVRGDYDIPEGYVRTIEEKMKRHLGCAVRVTSGVTHQNGRHTKGMLQIDFLDNNDLDRILKMLGVVID